MTIVKGISKNSDFPVSARKLRAQNRSVHGVHEDLSTELTRQSREKRIFRNALKLAVLLVLILPTPLLALGTDSEQPIAVEADSLEVREQDGISIYEGNVLLVQGSLELRSDRMVIHFNDAGELGLMEMTGSPARFRQLDDDQLEMTGQALKISYTASRSLLELRDEALFIHDGDTIESNLIRINTNDNSIQAGSSDSDQRVKMLIQPKQAE